MDLLIVTGAGASRELGAHGQMPLMGDWARSLRSELDQRLHGLADAAGLKDGLAATDFEETVGALLRWQELRGLAERFQMLGAAQPSVGIESYIPEHFKRESARLDQVVDAINVTLYELFGANQVEDDAAEDAYGVILKAANFDRLWFATTNYDPAIEIALAGLGYTPDTGFAQPRGGRAPQLAVSGLAGRAMGTTVPVVHLHGAVGWYEQSGIVRQAPTDEGFDERRGQPVVLHPDPDKDPTQHAIVSELWREFEAMLEAASHVLVLGHSLNDPALMRKLVQASPTITTAITFFEKDVAGKEFIGQQYKPFRGPTATLPTVFGPGEKAELDKVVEWLRATA